MQHFKDRLRELREERGLSMKELGNKVGVSDAAVCKWENGIAEPKVSYILRLADFFECSTDFLLGKNDDYVSMISADKANKKTNHTEFVAQPVSNASSNPVFVADGPLFTYDQEIFKHDSKKLNAKKK